MHHRRVVADRVEHAPRPRGAGPPAGARRIVLAYLFPDPSAARERIVNWPVFAQAAVAAPQETDQRLIVYTTPPDSPTARLLPILASWDAAGHPRTGRVR